MNDAVTNRKGLDLLRLAQPRPERLNRSGEIRHLLGRKAVVDKRCAVRNFGTKPATGMI